MSLETALRHFRLLWSCVATSSPSLKGRLNIYYSRLYLVNMPPLAMTGLVTKAGFMNKTATVTVSRILVHNRTGKRLERSKKYLIHDESNQLLQGDTVIIRNCPPISARKRFTLEKIVKSPETERLKLHENMSRAAEAESRSEAAEDST